jgi:hypothetical protein
MGGIGGDLQVQRYLFRAGLSGNGLDQAPQFPYVFDDIEGFELRDGFAFDVLIGMDILSRCDFTLNRNGHCTLTFG